ncbi:hypothetical protein OB919_15805 [Halobacteria archaeon AArc-curdl1]|uniref:Uncharacterized protein n=1 Tax=Natronosalvus hydrolyticus TaxID=2979988 RepID=A0AAP3E8N4_9EURY|nr:hypothetical protein [Halobacteria archaeon AArc-curdl1]
MYAADQVEKYTGMRRLREEHLGILIYPDYREFEDVREGVLLPEEDRFWEIHLHASDVDRLRNPERERPGFRYDTVMDFPDMDYQEMIEEEYPAWIETFEDRFQQSELNYMDVDLLSRKF